MNIASLPLAFALAAPAFDPNAYYRLTTVFQGECKSLDVVNDATDDKLVLDRSAHVSGQSWRISHLGGGYYRLTTLWKGAGKSLDIINDAQDNKPQLAATGNFLGQSWKITPLGGGRYRLTTEWKGTGKSLDVINDGDRNQLILANTAKVSGQMWRISKETSVGPVPAHLNLDSFYKKYLDADGIPIVGSAHVPDRAFYQVRIRMRQMLSRVPAVRTRMVQNKTRVAIMAHPQDKTLDIPEYKVFASKPFTADGRHMNTVRGFGGNKNIPVQLCSEENVLCLGVDTAKGEDIFIHEFAHTMHDLGFTPTYGNAFDNELNAAFANARSKKLWKDTYADVDAHEYFAEGVQSWFNTNLEGPINGNGIHKYANTRTELKSLDPKLHALLSKYFPDDENHCTCHPKAKVGASSSSASSGKPKRKFRLVKPKKKVKKKGFRLKVK